MRRPVIVDDSSEDDAGSIKVSLRDIQQKRKEDAEVAEGSAAARPPAKKKKRPTLPAPLDAEKPNSLPKRKVRVPHSVFPQEEKPTAGYWVATCKYILREPKGHIMLSVPGEPMFHRAISEVCSWAPHV